MNSNSHNGRFGLRENLHKLLSTAIIATLLVYITPNYAHADQFWVSADGRDTNPGTVQQPFATIKRAQTAAQEASLRGAPVTVTIRGGTYYLDEPLIFTHRDSGTQVAPVSYESFNTESVIISGGARVNLKWEPYKTTKIFQAKVPKDVTTDQLFINGDLQHLARYPNFDAKARIFNGTAADAISPERVKKWADPTGGFIHAIHGSEWGGFHYRITGKKDASTLTFEGGWQNNRPSTMHPKYRFVENIFEELDAPGEWYLDHKTATLYCYPPTSIDLSNSMVEFVRQRHLIEFQGTPQAPVRHVHLKGLTLRHTLRTFMENKEPLLRSDWTTYRGGAVLINGAEDCAVEDCHFDHLGGNALFVNNYNRRITIRGNHISHIGGNGIAFVGDRDATRVPRDWKDKSQSLKTLDRTPGPKTNNYPSDCIVEDCLIYKTGQIEKQTSPVQIELSQSITVRHCSLYDVPRAGINIGDGCWGGHRIEFCDVFDTVQETGDHGSFNSWGRDRFWDLSGLNLDEDKVWAQESKLPLLDAVKPTVLHNNRWRCDHGWDIDLDDGSSNYILTNNLCLNGGIKLREGFYRKVENNIMINNGFHPHVWFTHSQDVVSHNIMLTDHYLPAGGMPKTPWGKEIDYNIVHVQGINQRPAAKLAKQSQRDEHSVEVDVLFVDPAKGDFRVPIESPALKLGFLNFPMNEFGVQKPALKAIAKTPQIPVLRVQQSK